MAMTQPSRRVDAVTMNDGARSGELPVRGPHRSRRRRRLVLLAVLTVLVVAVPGVREAFVQLLVGVVVLVVLVTLVGLLAVVCIWRMVRRRPGADLLIGAWILRRHERRRQVVNARSWSGLPPDPYGDPRSWPPPGSRTWRP